MAVATGILMKSQHILPYNYGITKMTRDVYIEKLTPKGKLKYKAYRMFKEEHFSKTDISKFFEVNKSTISRWIKQTEKALEIRRYQILNSKSTRPKTTPRNIRLDLALKKLILELRDEYKCGHENISYYLKRDYDILVSPSTIHRFLTHLPKVQDPMYKCKIPVKKIKRKSKLIRIQQIFEKLTHRAFERFQIDTKYWIIDNHTYYIVTAIDVVTRMMFAYAYTRHTSRCAKDFLTKLNSVFNLKESSAYIQRDNGSEFSGEFEQECEQFGINVITNYVRMPKMNGYVERFNRTLKEQVLVFNHADNVSEVNGILFDYILQYNFDRAHTSLNRLTPFEKACELTFKNTYDYLFESQQPLLQMYRTSTILSYPVN